MRWRWRWGHGRGNCRADDVRHGRDRRHGGAPDGTVKLVASAATTPVTVSGLTQGVGYQCSVRAANSQTDSPASAALSVNLAAPATVAARPSAPQGVTLAAGNGSLSLRFTAPLSDGGFPVLGYSAVCTGGAGGSALSSPITMGGLRNGTAYTCTVAAVNAQGTGVDSTGVTATPQAAAGGATPPTSPTTVVAAAGNAQATLSFTAPTSTGGSPITSYSATCSGAGRVPVSASALSSPVTVPGLLNGRAYTCSLIATNAYGNSPAVASAAVTPSASLVNTVAPPASLTLSATVPSLAADGTSGVVAQVRTASGALYRGPDLTISFSSRCAAARTAALDASVVARNGLAAATYQPAAGCSGADALTANVVGSTLKASTTVVVSATAALSPKAALGKALFFDKALSGSGAVSCASCHSPANQFLAPDASATPLAGLNGQAAGLRSSPSATYAALAAPFRFLAATNPQGGANNAANGKLGSPRGGLMWDGRASDVFQQASGPFLATHEMANANSAAVRERLLARPYLASFTAVYGATTATSNADTVLTNTTLAGLGLGSLLNGAGLGAPGHNYYDLGFCGPVRTDSLLDAGLCGTFRTPGLRNVALKGSYFHNGVFGSLPQVLGFYLNRDANPALVYQKADGSADIAYNDLPTQFQANVVVRPPFTPAGGGRLSATEAQDLVAFLCTLTDGFDPKAPTGYRLPAQCSAAVRR